MKLLQQSYPASKSKKEIVVSAMFIAINVFFFLVVFQPFGTYTFSHPFKYVLLLPYAFITFLAFTLAGILMTGKIKNWNVAKEILKTITVLVVCSVMNYWYNARMINNTPFSIAQLGYMIIFTFAVGVPLTLFYMLIRYVYLLRNTNIAVRQIETEAVPATEETESRRLFITAEVGNEALELAATDFLFAEAEGNYCHVYYLNHGTVQKKLLRLSLGNFEQQIADENMLRCHRSFVVNLRKLSGIKGNAQGYKLTLDKAAVIVPVSRKYVPLLRAFIDKQAF